MAQEAARTVAPKHIAFPAPDDVDIAAYVPMGSVGGTPIEVAPRPSTIAAAVPQPKQSGLGRLDPSGDTGGGIGRLNPLEFAKEPSLREKMAIGSGNIDDEIQARLAQAQRNSANGVAPPVFKLEDIVDDGQSGWF